MLKESKYTKDVFQGSIYALFSEFKTTADAILKDSVDPELEITEAADTLESKLIDLLNEDLFSPKGAIMVTDALDGYDEFNEVADYFGLTSKEAAANDLRADGYLLIKPECLGDAEKIEEFLRQNIYPYNVNHNAGEL